MMMCRDKSHGGRRCPSHSDPEKIKARNARRREAYRKKVEAAKAEKTHPTVQTPVAPARSMAGHRTRARLQLQRTELRRHNLKADIVSSEDTETCFVSESQLHGTVDWRDLDSNSYKDFGFQDLSEIRREPLTVTDVRQLSMEAMEDGKTSVLGKAGINVITSENYEWINGALYGKGNTLNEPDVLIEPNLDAKNWKSVGFWGVSLPQCASSLQAVVAATDAGLAEATDGLQRIVYRGVPSDAGRVERDGGSLNHVRKHYKMGSTVEWAAYNSTAIGPSVAASYARGTEEEDGIVFEIRAASGAPISSVSEYDNEREYMLPRNARFMVVGVHENVEWKYEREAFGKREEGTLRNVQVVQLVEVTDDGRIQDDSTVASRTPKPLTPEQLVETKG